MIASGTWKAKKHKAMAAEARAAWKALKHQIGEQLWLRHVVKPGEHQWARGAHVIAGRGKQGIRTQVEHLRRAVLTQTLFVWVVVGGWVEGPIRH